ncbi:MAG TPA: hypothetical protein VF621_17410 [Pyrinomonadaceae bacterium]
MADKSEERRRGYVVISTTLSGDVKKYGGRKVIPSGDVHPAIYRQVYGPAGKRDCEKWVAANCARSGAATG